MVRHLCPSVFAVAVKTREYVDSKDARHIPLPPFPETACFPAKHPSVPRAERCLHGAIRVHLLRECLAGATFPPPSISVCTTPEFRRVQFGPGDNVGPCMVKVVVVGWLGGEEVLADLLLQVCSSAPPKTLFQHCSFPRGLYSCWVEMIFFWLLVLEGI